MISVAIAMAAACARPKPAANLRFDDIRLSNEYAGTVPVAHPAPGYTFATIHFTQSAYAPERYDWLHGVVVYDVQGRWYRPKFTSYIHGESGGTFLFGLTTRSSAVQTR